MRHNILWIEPDTPEWEWMWRALAAEIGAIDQPDPDSQETWQYMGSSADKDGVLHEFRHRCLKGKRAYARISGAKGCEEM